MRSFSLGLAVALALGMGGLARAATPPAGAPSASPPGAAAPGNAAQGAEAPAVTPPAPTGPMPTVTAAVDSASTSIGSRILLTLRVDAPPGWFIEAPAPPAELGAFRVRSMDSGTAVGTQRVFTLSLVPVKAGDVEVPPVSVRARQGNAEPIEIPSPSVRVHVSSNLGAEAPHDSTQASVKPADLKPARVPPRDWRPVWIALAAAAIGFALATLLFRRLRRRPQREVVPQAPKVPTRPAWEIALEELDGIVADRLVERGELARQYESCADVLRRYLENRWGVPALESTTDDLRRLLQTAPVPPAFAGRVISLLSEADLVKFAKGRPEVHAARGCETKVREMVVETTPREEPTVAAA